MDRVASEFRRYADARVAWQRYRDGIVPQATESLKLTQQAHAAKQVGDLELLKAHETYIRMHLAQLDALRNMRISQVALEGLVVRQE
jgi:outer membrane protein TolC